MRRPDQTGEASEEAATATSASNDEAWGGGWGGRGWQGLWRSEARDGICGETHEAKGEVRDE